MINKWVPEKAIPPRCTRDLWVYKQWESDIGSHLADGGDVDVGVVEEEHVDGTADADAVLPEDVVLFALRRQHGLLLFRAWK